MKGNRFLIPVLFTAALPFAAGCPENNMDRLGPGISLVEIGERSLESAERLEAEGDARQARIAYQRAVWAFRYHQSLTRESPLLLGEAEEGAKRTGGR